MLRFVSCFGPFLEEKLPEIGTDDDVRGSRKIQNGRQRVRIEISFIWDRTHRDSQPVKDISTWNANLRQSHSQY